MKPPTASLSAWTGKCRAATYASLFPDSLAYISSHNLYIIFVGTGILFTRDIVDNQNANYRGLMDFMVQSKIDALQAENQNLKLAASQAAQNNFLVNELRPLARPAYITCNPYTGGYGYAGYNGGCGCNSGCGC